MFSGLLTISCTPKKQIQETSSVENIIEEEEKEPAMRKHYNPSEKRVNDLLHTKLKVNFDWENQQLNGEAYLTLRPYFYATDSLTLDAKAMDIHSVRQNDGKSMELAYTYDGQFLRIVLPKEYNRTEQYNIYIKYTAKPEEVKQEGSSAISSAKGLYFINHDGVDKNKHMEIWTQGETEASSAWFPTIDSPNEKTTEEIYITVKDKYTTLSNGLLVESTPNENGTRTDYWKMDQPHSPYLFMMAVGEFAVVKDTWKKKDSSEIEVSYYVEKKFEPHARAIFGKTPKMIKHFSELLGVEYPWAKYSQVVVRDYVSGAMENTSATIHGEFLYQTKREIIDGGNESIIAHELFHHWFGDLVTCESWSNLPLNESFANYSQFLWDDFEHGRMEADMNAYGEMEGYFMSAQQGGHVDMIRFDYKSKEDMFDGHSYNKGGRILNMLRSYVGDDAFFASLKLYLTENAHKSAEIHDLRLAFEETTGEDLNWFFNQWFLSSGHPVLKYEQEYNAETKKLTVSITQKQDTEKWPVYKLPIYIDIYVGGKPRREMVWVENVENTFEFNASSEPNLVNIDAKKVLLAKKTDKKSLEQSVYQLNHAGLWLDKKEAIDKCGKSSDPAAVEAIINALNQPFWNVKTMAMSKIKKAVKAKPEVVKNKLKTLAAKDDNPKVRGKAIKTLMKYFSDDKSLISAYEIGLKDSSYRVMGTALAGVTSIDPEKGLMMARAMEGAESASVNNAIAAIYAKKGDLKEHAFFLETVSELNGMNKLGFLQKYNEYVLRMPNEEIDKAIIVYKKIVETESIWFVKLSGYNLLASVQNFYSRRAMEISTEIESAQVDGKSEQVPELEKQMNICKIQDTKVASLLNELKALETDSNVKKYLGM
jgi:aminopeptidase N